MRPAAADELVASGAFAGGDKPTRRAPANSEDTDSRASRRLSDMGGTDSAITSGAPRRSEARAVVRTHEIGGDVERVVHLFEAQRDTLSTPGHVRAPHDRRAIGQFNGTFRTLKQLIRRDE